jgi:hypothetical protein
MVKTIHTPGSSITILLIAFAIASGSGCAGIGAPMQDSAYQYFGKPDPGDAWSRKIRGWQVRQEASHAAERAIAVPAVSEPGERNAQAALHTGNGTLLQKYASFRADRKRHTARELTGWIQRQARKHYIDDGPVDHWATFEETMKTNGDDCDGLELLVFNLLHDLGFDSEEIYRAVVYRKTDGQHHMVTLWFEDPKDPWVIDPTGAMTTGMPRMSDVPAWVPIKVFTEDRDYTVRELALR